MQLQWKHPQHAQEHNRQRTNIAMLVVLALSLILAGCGSFGALAGTSDESSLDGSDEAAIYRRLAHFKDADGMPPLEEVLAAILRSG